MAFISLREKQATVSGLSFRNGDVRLTGGNNNVEKDTTPATPFDWTIDLQKLELAEVRYLMCVGIIKTSLLQREIPDCYFFFQDTRQTDVQTQLSGTEAPWLIEVGTASVADYAFSMEPAQGKGFELNLSRIAITQCSFQVNALFFKGSRDLG
mgnify:CR=1 FL=1